MNNKLLACIIVVMAILLGGWYLLNQNNQAPAVQNTADQPNQAATENNQTQTNPAPAEISTVQNHEVTYIDSGYSPSTLTIKVGDTVTWKNQSSHGMWTASAMHLSHTVYSGTSLQQHCPDSTNNSFDECKSDEPGSSWSFTFTKKGTWGYHNHVKASDFGKVVVQ